MRSFTLTDAAEMPFNDLLNKCYAALEPYEAPDGESTPQRQSRIDRTLDQVPDLLAWFLQLESYFDNIASGSAEAYGMKSHEYKDARVRRDAMERVAKAAKLRYEGTSRGITYQMGFENAGIAPRSR